MTLSDEQIQELLRVGNPTDEECRLIRMGWDAAMRTKSIPDGWKLVPIEPTEKMINEGTCASTLPGPHYIESACAKQCWVNMIAAAPKSEAKP